MHRPRATQFADGDLEGKFIATVPASHNLADLQKIWLVAFIDVSFDQGIVFSLLRVPHQYRKTFAEHLVRRVAKDCLGSWVEGFNRPVGVKRDNAVDDGFDDRAGVLFSDLSGSLSTLEIGDVGLDRDRSACGGPVFVDLKTAAIRQILFYRAGRLAVIRETVTDPILFSLLRVRDQSVGGDGSDHGLECRAGNDGRSRVLEHAAKRLVA